MDNKTKPEGNLCPRCQGWYDWSTAEGRCLMCGYVWNPLVVPQVQFKIPHCCFGQCVRPIPKLENIFCSNHAGETVGEGTRANLLRQRRYTQRKANMEDGQIRLNAPIMVKLKAQYRKTVA